VLDDPARLTAYLAAALGRERVEQFRILFLDDRGVLKADEIQAKGTVNHTPVYPREVVRRALELGASALVLVHNHPSGDPAPSVDDIDMTAEIGRAAEALGIELRDHIIVGNGRTLSFKDTGLL
jgi:DNA repair protein RadC